jgi:predicted enzyme involved in methoxymalonyl-ACP biosynthesis
MELIRERARALDLCDVRLTYQPSSKNGLVPSILEALGFESRGDGIYSTATAVPDPTPRHHIHILNRRGKL